MADKKPKGIFAQTLDDMRRIFGTRCEYCGRYYWKWYDARTCCKERRDAGEPKPPYPGYYEQPIDPYVPRGLIDRDLWRRR